MNSKIERQSEIILRMKQRMYEIRDIRVENKNTKKFILFLRFF